MTPAPPIGGYRLSDLPRVLGLALLFAVLVKGTLHWFSTQNELVSLVWAPSGVALGALLLWGRRFWLGVFLGALLVNVIDGHGVAVAIAFAAANALEALAACWLLQRWPQFDRRLERATDYLWLLLAASFGALISAGIGVSVMGLADFSDVSNLPTHLLHWWQGDALGMAVVTPLLLVLAQPFASDGGRWQPLEALILAALALLSGVVVFLTPEHTGWGEAPRLYLMFVLLPWAALRFGRHGTVLLSVTVAVLAAIGVLEGTAAFGAPGTLTAYFNLWLYLLVYSVVGLLLALTLKQRRRAEARAQQVQVELQASLDRAELAAAELVNTVEAQRKTELALEQQKLFLETILENEPECVKLVSASGRLLQMNQAGLAMLEVDTLEQAQQSGLAEFVAASHRRQFLKLHQSVCAGASGQLAFPVVGKRGTVRWLETNAVPFTDRVTGEPCLLGVTRDITARRQAEMREAIDSRVMSQIATGAELLTILDTLVRGVEAQSPESLCSVVLLDEQCARLVMGAGPSLPAFFNDAVHGEPIGPVAGSCGTAIYRGERVIVQDIANDPLWRTCRDLAAKAGLAACWSEPIIGSEKRVLGSFAVYRRQPVAPSDADLAMIAAAARTAAVAIERRHAEEELRSSEQRYQRVVDSISDGLMVDDIEGRVVFANQRFLDMFGFTRDQLATISFEDYVAPEYREELRNRHERRIRGEDVAEEFEFEGLRTDGERRWLEVRVSRVTVGGVVTGTQSLIRDISERKQSQALIWQQANFDELTGLPNRRMLRDRLDQEIRKSRREGLSLAVLLIDLDRFKEVNDTLGHDAGDVLLVEAAKRIHACVRDTDTVARLGGDEFVVALSELAGHDRVDDIAQAIIASLIAPFEIKGEQAFVSASIGITLYPADASGIDELLKHADQAMYAAKDAGRNRFSYFTPSLQVAAVARMRLTNDLRSALGNGELRAYFQPVVDLASGCIVKAEALVRWQHPQRGMVSPGDFIPLAESSGLIFEISDWMVQQAAFWAKRWRNEVAPDFQVSVNQSPLEFQREGRQFPACIDVVRELGLPGHAIVLEITEGLLLDASSAVTDKLLALRDAGMQVALDDFGTGYSSLSYLKEFDIDYLKIDQSFTRNLAPGSSSLALSEAIIVMAHKLGMKVIAEGVETETQRKLLQQAGCDFGQGYLFGRPMPAMSFDALLKARSGLANLPG